MKSKSIAAIAIAAAVLVFAFYQFSKTKEQKPFLIAGEWRGDSIYSVSKIDTSLSLFGIDMLQLADKRVLVFNADSTITDVFKMKDSASAKYYLRDSVIFIDEGKGFTPYTVLQLNNDQFSFMTKDSIVMVFKRK
jgi:hypothetical protein